MITHTHSNARAYFGAAFCALLVLLPACAKDAGNMKLAESCPASGKATEKNAGHAKFLAPALKYLEKNKSRYGNVNPNTELGFICEITDELGTTHVRFQQVHNGVPIWAQQMIVHFDAAGEPTTVSGGYRPIAQTIDARPKLSEAAAAQAAVKAKGADSKAEKQALYVYPNGPDARLAYQITRRR
jgi:Zn-dependent metalloprotease